MNRAFSSIHDYRMVIQRRNNLPLSNKCLRRLKIRNQQEKVRNASSKFRRRNERRKKTCPQSRANRINGNGRRPECIDVYKIVVP